MTRHCYTFLIPATEVLKNPKAVVWEMKPDFYEKMCDLAGYAAPGWWNLGVEQFLEHTDPLHENIGCEYCNGVSERWGWCFERDPQTSRMSKNIILMFLDRDKALLCKLTYGGDLVAINAD